MSSFDLTVFANLRLHLHVALRASGNCVSIHSLHPFSLGAYFGPSAVPGLGTQGFSVASDLSCPLGWGRRTLFVRWSGQASWEGWGWAG